MDGSPAWKLKSGKIGFIPILSLALLATVLIISSAYAVDIEGNDPLTALPIFVGVEVNANMETVDDIDFFSFEAQAGASYHMETNLGALVDSVLTLYASDGVTPLAFNDDCGSFRISQSLRSCITYTFNMSGVYFLEVASWANCCSGSYNLLVSELTYPAGDDHVNVHSPGATLIVADDQQVPGTLEIPEDVDFFRFDAQAGQRFYFEVTLSGLVDSIIYLYDRDGFHILKLNDDCNDSAPHSCLDYTFAVSGAYYVAVTSYDHSALNTGAGGYSILMREVCLTCVVPAQGLVFRPNPVVSSQNTSLQDNFDADSTELNSQRVQVSFDIFEPLTPNAFMLDGPFATTRGTFNRAQESTPDFSYTRNDDRFEEVMAYYQIDLMQRYIQDTLGFPNVVNKSISISTNGIPDDNSFYDLGDQSITFGSGGVDDAEDAEIIAHEYGHAIQDDQVPLFGLSHEAGAMGEGFGDYWAASFYSAYSGGFQDACVGDWDAKGFIPSASCLRRVDGTKHYPEDMSNPPDVHADGEIWSATLWEIRNKAGREDTDRMVIQSHFYLNANATFADGAQAIILADQDLYRGLYECIIKDAFFRRGILDAAASQCANKLHAPVDAKGSVGATQAPVEFLISTSQEVGSVSFTVTFDSNIMAPNATTPCAAGSLTSGWGIVCDSSQQGELAVTLSAPLGSSIPPLSQGILVTLFFDISGQAQIDQHSALDFSGVIEIRDPLGNLLSSPTLNNGILTVLPPCSSCDANGDGLLNVLDVIRMLNMGVGSASLPQAGSHEFQCVDKNSDNQVNVLDTIGCLKVILGQ